MPRILLLTLRASPLLQMLAERRGYAMPKSMMAPVPAPAPGPAMANAMDVDLAEAGSSRRLQAAQTKTVVAGRGSAAAPAGAVAGKVRPALRSSAIGCCNVALHAMWIPARPRLSTLLPRLRSCL